MPAPAGRDTALYLPGVETRHQPGTYHDLIAAARAQGAEYSKITATGVPEMSQDAHRRQGKALAEHGYTRD